MNLARLLPVFLMTLPSCSPSAEDDSGSSGTEKDANVETKIDEDDNVAPVEFCTAPDEIPLKAGVFTLRVLPEDDMIALPLVKGGTYDFLVDWGDGTFDSIQGTEDFSKAVHTYADANQKYVLEISGTVIGWSHQRSALESRMKELEVFQWGTLALGATHSQFEGQTISICAADAPDLSRSTSLEDVFRGSHGKPELRSDLSSWDLSTIESLKGAFSRSNLQADVSGWNVSNVTNMSFLFKGNSALDWNISSWDVANVTSMRGMFQSSDFDGQISDWDVSRVTDMQNMFSKSKFNGDISSWDVSQATNMREMFRSSKFAQSLSNWDVSRVQDMNHMFYRSLFNGDISNWDVSRVTDMSGMFQTSKFDGDVSRWNVSNVVSMFVMFNGSSFTGELSNWDVRSLTDIDAMFLASPFEGDVSNWDIANLAVVDDAFSLSKFCGDRHALPSGPSADPSEQYNRLLIGWGRQEVQPNVTLRCQSTYSSGAAAEGRERLVQHFGWNIIDLGEASSP